MPIPLSIVRKVVEAAFRDFSDVYGEDLSTVDEVFVEAFGIFAFAAFEDDGTGDDPFAIPKDFVDHYDEHYKEWQATKNFPWRLEVITIGGQDFYLGYVSDCGNSAFQYSWLFERIIYLYPVEWFDIFS